MLVPFPTENTVSPSGGIPKPSVWIVLDLEAKKKGSVEEQLLALGRRLTEAGVAATFVFSSEPPPWMLAEFTECGVELRWVDFRRPRQALPTVARWLYAARPSVVHFHFVRAYSPLVAVAKAVGARVLVHDHMALGVAFVQVRARNRLVQGAVHAWKRTRAALLNRLVDQRIAVSRFVAESLEQAEFVSPSGIAILEHGIDLMRFANASSTQLRSELNAGDRPIIACVSRMGPEKGVDVLIRAHARVGRNAVLAIAGDGPDKRKCQALAAELHLGDRVHFLGLRNDVERILAGCDIAVVPSQAPEAFGLSVVEAMAAGKPVVVTDAGAMGDIVDQGRCGTIVPAGDDAALADAIGHLIDGPTFAQIIGNAGRQRAFERYGLHTWVERITALYSSAIPALAAPRRLHRAAA